MRERDRETEATSQRDTTGGGERKGQRVRRVSEREREANEREQGGARGEQ